MKIYDITPDILCARLYPGDSMPRLERRAKIADGNEYNLSDISMCLHTGAHIDAVCCESGKRPRYGAVDRKESAVGLQKADYKMRRKRVSYG